MIVIISGTNRSGSNTLKVARLAEAALKEWGRDVFLIDLQEMPAALFDPASYVQKPEAFRVYQKAIFDAQGILSVIPEYNGSYPGVYKYFIDMLKFPESLVDIPAAFIGVAAGEWGGLRAVEQAEMVFNYRSAPLYGKRLFLKNAIALFDKEGRFKDPALLERFTHLLKGFISFCDKLKK